MGSDMHTTRLLGKAGVAFSCALLMMSCGDAPRELGTGPVAEQADAGKLELGKEYPLPDEAAHIKEISDLFTGLSERKYPPNVRPMRRDAHTRAHGCVKADFTVASRFGTRQAGLFWGLDPARRGSVLNVLPGIRRQARRARYGDQGDGRRRRSCSPAKAREDPGLPPINTNVFFLAEHGRVREVLAGYVRTRARSATCSGRRGGGRPASCIVRRATR